MHAEASFSSEFPSVISDDSLEPSPYHAALFHLRQGLQALCDLSPGADPTRKEEHEQIIALQKQVLQLLHIHFAPDGEANGTQRFGDVLRHHRDEAKLTQEQLADYSGLSLSYVRKLEQGSKPPSRNVLLALCSVPDLKLVPTEITSLPAVREYSYRLAPNWYVSPNFDSVQMLHDFAQQLNGGGCAIEQTYAYMDHKSAMDWISLCTTPSYVTAFRESMPHHAIVKRLREVVGHVGMDVIALGPGDGKTEVRLVQQILEDSERANLRFYLFDVSQPLLNRAFKHAVDTFNDEPGIFVCGIQGNFHHLPRYTQLHYTPARSHRRRVYTMLGNTIGNTEHEPNFFQNVFSGAAPGDLLLFDVDYVFTKSSDPEEIQRKDPAFHHPIPEAHKRWLSGPISRYCQGVQDLEFSLRLDCNRPLAGSYGIQCWVKASFLGNETRRFQMFNFRRYDPQGLIRCLRGFGWESVGVFPFTGSETRPRGLLMFQRQLPRMKH